jgi:hypothetical protein
LPRGRRLPWTRRSPFAETDGDAAVQSIGQGWRQPSVATGQVAYSQPRALSGRSCEQLFDKRTGVINKQVAAYWKEHFDLLYYLQRHWPTVGPKLVDKLYFYTGDVDTYYLNNSTKELEKWMKTTTNPHYEGSSCTATASRTAGPDVLAPTGCCDR